MNINRASFQPSSRQPAATGPTSLPATKTRPIAAWRCSETHLFTAKLVNEFRFGYNRVHSRRFQFNFNKNISADLGIPGVPFTSINGGMPEFDFGDVDSIGDPTYLPSLEIQNTYSYSDNLTWIRDKHTIKFGGEIRK